MAIPFQERPRQKPDLAEIAKLIAWLGGDEAGIQQVLAQLGTADWSAILARVAPEIARNKESLAFEEALRNGMLICHDCRQTYPFGSSPGPGCASCAAKRKEASFNTLSGSFASEAEPGRLTDALRRARAAGTPATLTLQEWVDALDFFDGWCAYCQQKPFTVIEHFLPIGLGGGTTADNCVPACHGCNASKTDQHPDHLHTEGIKRVRAYLASKQRGNAA